MAWKLSKKSVKQKSVRFVKKLAVTMNIMPKTMAGKKFFKRIVFGKLVEMPFEMSDNEFTYSHPTSVIKGKADYDHKVIYCSATLGTRRGSIDDK